MNEFIVITSDVIVPVLAQQISEVPYNFYNSLPLAYNHKIMGVIRKESVNDVIKKLTERQN